MFVNVSVASACAFWCVCVYCVCPKTGRGGQATSSTASVRRRCPAGNSNTQTRVSPVSRRRRSKPVAHFGYDTRNQRTIRGTHRGDTLRWCICTVPPPPVCYMALGGECARVGGKQPRAEHKTNLANRLVVYLNVRFCHFC